MKAKEEAKIEPCWECKRKKIDIWSNAYFPVVWFSCPCGNYGPVRKTRDGAIRAWNRISKSVCKTKRKK